MQLRVYLAGALALALITALLWFYFDGSDGQNSGLDSKPLEITVEAPAMPKPVEQSKQNVAPDQVFEDPGPQKKEIVLPSLNESDAFVREQAASLNGNALWSDWITRDELIRRFTVIIENAARGDLPRRQLGFLAPRGSFKVKNENNRIYLDSVAYSRYDTLVDVIMTLPVDTSAQFLITLQPLVEEALQELGVKETDSQSVLRAAIDQVLATPVVHGEIELKQPKVFYLYADENLESLSALQKQIMRMGPSNTLRLQTFVRRLVLSLEGDLL